MPTLGFPIKPLVLCIIHSMVFKSFALW